MQSCCHNKVVNYNNINDCYFFVKMNNIVHIALYIAHFRVGSLLGGGLVGMPYWPTPVEGQGPN